MEWNREIDRNRAKWKKQSETVKLLMPSMLESVGN